jgi:hypothetical protein
VQRVLIDFVDEWTIYELDEFFSLKSSHRFVTSGPFMCLTNSCRLAQRGPNELTWTIYLATHLLCTKKSRWHADRIYSKQKHWSEFWPKLAVLVSLNHLSYHQLATSTGTVSVQRSPNARGAVGGGVRFSERSPNDPQGARGVF